MADGQAVQMSKTCGEGDTALYMFADNIYWKQNYLMAFTLGSSPSEYFASTDVWEGVWAKTSGLSAGSYVEAACGS